VSSVDLRTRFADMSFHPTDGGAVIYDAAGKRLFALNETAAFVWLAVRDGITREAMRRELHAALNLSVDEAENWIELALGSLDRLSLAERPEPSARPHEPAIAEAPPPPPGVHYALLGQTVRISAPKAAFDRIDSMIGHLKQPPSDGDSVSAALSISVKVDGAKFVVSGGREPARVTGPEQLAAEIEHRIVQGLLPRVPHFLTFHAALMYARDRGILFPAPSGSGKTTLSVALTGAGWSYRTDEMALLDRHLTWQGLPLPPCIKATSYLLIEPLQPSLRHVIEHDRFGCCIKFLPVKVESSPLTVSTVIFPRYQATAQASVRPLRQLEGLTRLLTQCLYVPEGFCGADVGALLGWHDQAKYYEMEFGSPHQAVAVLGETL
jgi:hypothetical protein